MAGRAGRKNINGEVFIQTFQPYHPVVRLSLESNYEKFINYELKKRKNSFLPPFSSFISIIITSKDENVSHDYGLNLRSILKDNF